MRGWWRFTAIGVLAAGMMLALGSSPSMAQSRAHVYLLRGLLNIFSLGMDTLCDELNRRGVYATVDNHADWQSLADGAAARYKAGKEGPIIIIGHSLGADAAMEMAAYLGTRGVPVALVVPFDGTSSYPATANVARVLNLTQHFYMQRGPGFHGSLINVDLRGDPNIDHLNIDKSPRLHARVIGEVLGIVGARRATEPSALNATGSVPAAGTEIAPVHDVAAKPAEGPASAGSGEPAKPKDAQVAPVRTDNAPANATGATTNGYGTPVIALPERSHGGTNSDVPAASANTPHQAN
jgi:pimeloyl-ACP methyl ester carboxylesterase